MPAKYAKSCFGEWSRDADNLPCFDLEPGLVPPFGPVLRHHIGHSGLHVLADHLGRLQFFVSSPRGAMCLNPLDGTAGLGVYVRLQVGEADVGVFPARRSEEPGSSVRWGIGYATYVSEAEVDARRVTAELDLVLPPERSLLLVHLTLRVRGKEALPCVVRVGTDMGLASLPETAEDHRHLFRKPGVAMFTDLHPYVGDLFIASSQEWSAAPDDGHLALTREADLRPRAAFTATFLLGCGPDCSVDWLGQELVTHSADALREANAERLTGLRLRTPELWMQEECLWDDALFSSFVCQPPDGGRPRVSPGGTVLFGDWSGHRTEADAAGVRDLLTLCLPLAEVAPTVAESTLLAVTAGQARSGRCPNTLGQLPADLVDPHRDRSDLEILFLLSWMGLLAGRADLSVLDAEVPCADGDPAPVWDHLRSAYHWLSHEVRTGPNGHIRLLAGDWNGLLNQAGTLGQGESVLNTAMLCYALRPLVEVARKREDNELADDAAAWHRGLSEAVGEAFDGGWFIRAYTDRGKSIGNTASGRLFVDVQAWAALARCGTPTQRAQALRATLELCATDEGVTSLSRAHPCPPPTEVSSAQLLPGDRENGGVSAAVSAWLVWALVTEGLKDRAFPQWELASLRHRSAGPRPLPPELAAASGWTSSGAAGGRAGLPALVDSLAGNCFPAAGAFAWQGFAMRKLLA